MILNNRRKVCEFNNKLIRFLLNLLYIIVLLKL